MFDAIKKVLNRARDERAQLLDQLQACRREMAVVQAQPRARADVIAATDHGIQFARHTALEAIHERGQRLVAAGSDIPSAGALPVDDRGRVAISHDLLLALLAGPMQALTREALAQLPEGLTSAQRAAQVERIRGQIAVLETKLRELEDQADAAGVNL